MAANLNFTGIIFFLSFCVLSQAFFTSPQKLFSSFLKDIFTDGNILDDIESTETKTSYRSSVRGENLKWRDCGGTKLKFRNLDIVPDPLVASTKANISVVFEALEDLKGRINLNLTIFRKARGKVTRIPCIANVGSCVYHNMCSKLNMRSGCPDPIIESGFNCKCPLHTGVYDIKKYRRKIPGDILSGQYRVRAQFLEKDEMIGCLEIDCAVIHLT